MCVRVCGLRGTNSGFFIACFTSLLCFFGYGLRVLLWIRDSFFFSPIFYKLAGFGGGFMLWCVLCLAR